MSINSVGEKLKKKREELDYSFGKLSNLSGVDKAEISRIENGERKNPNPITIKKIAEVLGLDIIELYEEMGLLDIKDKTVIRQMLNIFNNEDLKKILELYQKEITFEAMKQNKIEDIKEKVEGIQKIIEKIK